MYILEDIPYWQITGVAVGCFVLFVVIAIFIRFKLRRRGDNIHQSPGNEHSYDEIETVSYDDVTIPPSQANEQQPFVDLERLQLIAIRRLQTNDTGRQLDIELERQAPVEHEKQPVLEYEIPVVADQRRSPSPNNQNASVEDESSQSSTFSNPMEVDTGYENAYQPIIQGRRESHVYTDMDTQDPLTDDEFGAGCENPFQPII